MSDCLTERDCQCSEVVAWHSKTKITKGPPTREDCMNYELVEVPLFYKRPATDEEMIEQLLPTREDVIVEHPTFRQLLAEDDWLPVGPAFGASYSPGNRPIESFWNVIASSLEGVPYEVVSAGTTMNREVMFASIRLTDGFEVGGRKYNEYLTLLDSLNASFARQFKYNNVCVVCMNTVLQSLSSGVSVGKAKHTVNFETNLKRLIEDAQSFHAVSELFKAMLERAYLTPCSRDEARSWIAGITGQNAKIMTNGLRNKIARITELFDCGAGCEGRTHLDAFQALTDYYTHESTLRKETGAQWSNSEFGSGAQIKTLAATRFEENWKKYVLHGEHLLAEKTSTQLVAAEAEPVVE